MILKKHVVYALKSVKKWHSEPSVCVSFHYFFCKIKTAYTPVFLTNVAADKPPSKVEAQPSQTAIPKQNYRSDPL